MDMSSVKKGRAGKKENYETYHLFEVCKTEDRIVDLDGVCSYVGHGYCINWDGGETGVGTRSVRT
jgi:hypothetical protein